MLYKLKDKTTNLVLSSLTTWPVLAILLETSQQCHPNRIHKLKKHTLILFQGMLLYIKRLILRSILMRQAKIPIESITFSTGASQASIHPTASDQQQKEHPA